MADTSSRDMDGGWAWVVLLAASLIIALQEGFVISVGIFQVEFLESFSGSQGFVALIGAVSLSSQVMYGPVAGVVTDLVTHRVAIIIGGTLLSIGMVSTSFSPDLTTLLLLFGFVTGLGLGLSYTPSITVSSTYFRKYRTISNGINLASTGVGLLAVPYLLRFLIDSHGWRWAMAIYTCIMAQICVLGALLFPRRPGQLRISGSCLPSGKDPARKSSQNEEDANTLIPRNDQHQKEPEVMAGPGSVFIPKSSPSRSDLEKMMAASWTELRTKGKAEVTGGSVTDLMAKARSKSLLEVRTRSGTELRSRAVSRLQMEEMRGSRTSVDLARYGSVMLNESVVWASEEHIGPSSVWQRVKRLLCRRFMWVMCINQLFMMSGPSIHFILFPAYVQSIGLPIRHVSALFMAFGVTVTVSRVAGGFVFSLIPNHLLHAFFCFQVGMALGFLLMPVYGLSLTALFVDMIFIGGMYGPGFLLVTPILLRYVGLTDLSVAFGLVMLSSGVAFVLAPSVAGMTYDVFRSYSASYYIAGSAVGTAALSLLLLFFISDLEPPGAKDKGSRKDRLLSTNQSDSNTASGDSSQGTANGNLPI